MGKRIETSINPNGTDMYKFGNIELSVTEEELKKVFEFGDTVKVTIENVGSFVMPFFHYYDEVKPGELVLCTYTKGSYAIIAKNYRAFGVEVGLLEVDAKNENFRLRNLSSISKCVTIELERRPNRTAERGLGVYRRIGERTYDFRTVGGNTIHENIIFRSSSPVDGRLSDSARVDKQAEKVGVQSIIDLADTKTEAEQLPGFDNTYCSKCKIAYLNLPLAFTSPLFKSAVYSGITFIANNKPPYLVFCSEGRDRTGVFIALLQAMCGTDWPQIVSDYAFSFELRCGDKLSKSTLDNIEYSIKNSLCSVLALEKITQETLQKDTEKFLLSTGLTYETICKVKSILGAKA